LGSTCIEEIVDASPEKDLEDDLSEEESASAPSKEELGDVPAEEDLELANKTSALNLQGLKAERILPLRVPLARSSSGVLT